MHPHEAAVVPYLFRFAQPCVSPSRYQPAADCYYDGALQIVRWRGEKGDPPAIEAAMPSPPQTKKNDLEKGEDSKDMLMWR